jgi:hypothetical protein
MKKRGFKITDYRYSTLPSKAKDLSTMHWGSWMMWGSKLKSLGSNTGLANMTDYTNSIQNWRPCYCMQSRNMSSQPTTLLVPENSPELESRHSTSMFRCHHPLVNPVLLPLPCTILLCSQFGPRSDDRASNASSNSQGKVTLSKKDNKGKHKRLYFCLMCSVIEDHTGIECKHCMWCSKNHIDDHCEDPHIQYTKDKCLVPLTYPNHRLLCPELLNQMAVDLNCEFCEVVGDTCMEAST